MPVPQRSEIRIWPISLKQIEATVSDFVGPGRIRSNSPKPAFSRSVSMYLGEARRRMELPEDQPLLQWPASDDCAGGRAKDRAVSKDR